MKTGKFQRQGAKARSRKEGEAVGLELGGFFTVVP
jgi:hypothetical protein